VGVVRVFCRPVPEIREDMIVGACELVLDSIRAKFIVITKFRVTIATNYPVCVLK
jgi:hypothetical protein